MARMFPEHGPVKPNTRESEHKVFRTLASALSDEYLVFHGSTWQATDDARRSRNGEVDFIVIHPDKGIILLEIKGGAIKFDGLTGKWQSTDRSGHTYVIKDPFDQVSSSMHFLARHIKQAPATRDYAKQYWLGYGVWFPDTEWPRGRVSLPSVNDDYVLDIRDMSDPLAGLERVFAHFPNRKHISEPAIDALINMLAETIQTQLRLRSQMAEEERTFAVFETSSSFGLR